MGVAGGTRIPETMNGYLFSVYSDNPTAECVIADRRIVLFVVSGCALLLGLGVMYVRAMRHPGLVFAAGVALLQTAGAKATDLDGSSLDPLPRKANGLCVGQPAWHAELLNLIRK